jgi:hypothetical protein
VPEDPEESEDQHALRVALNWELLWSEVRRIQKKIEGPPFPGMEKQLSDLLTDIRVTEKMREEHQAERHRQNQEQQEQTRAAVEAMNAKIGQRNLLVAIAALLVSIFSVVGIFAGAAVSYYALKHSGLEPLRLFDDGGLRDLATAAILGLKGALL